MRNNCKLAAIAAALAFVLTSCGRNEAEHVAEVTTGGDIHRGASAIEQHGCGSCHTIPGISGANGIAGPPLSGIGSRIYVAGVLQNTPSNLMRWIKNPKAVDEKTVMPNLGLSDQEARDIAGYLYTLK